MKIVGISAALIALLFFQPSALAADSDIEVSFTGTCAVAPASYTIKIENNAKFSDIFRITTLGGQRNWVILEQRAIRVSPKSSGEFHILSFPPSNADPGTYRIPVRVYADSDPGFHFDTEICVFVKEVREITFSEISLNNERYAPGDDLELKFTLSNTGTEGFVNTQLSYEVSGPSNINLQDKIFDLGRGDSLTFNEEVDISNMLIPGEYTILIELVKDNKILGSSAISFTIVAVDRIEVDKGGIWTPLANFRKIKFENVGNIPSAKTATLEVRRPFNAFVSAGDNPEITEGTNTVTYQWDAELLPGESLKVSYRVNYWPIVLALLAVGYGVYKTYTTLRRPTIKKVLLNSRELKDDMYEHTIAIEVKNHTPHDIKKVVVRDYVPPIARVVKDFGALVPKTKVTEGTELVWTISNFSKDETRMIRYRVVTVIGAIDKFRLPKAVVEGSIGKYNFKSHSNSLGVGSSRNK